MKKSIGFKLFITIAALGFVFIIASNFINRQFFEKYYIDQLEESLYDYSLELDESYTGDIAEIEGILNEIEATLNSSVSITTQNGDSKYSTTGFTVRKPPQPGNGDAPNNTDDYSAFPFNLNNKRNRPDYSFRIKQDQKNDSQHATFLYELNNGDRLMVTTPLNNIARNVEIVNSFFKYTGITLIFLGMIFALFFARLFSRPIREINAIAHDMANLNFDRKCHINSNDELGELGMSINHLSVQLQRAIQDLNEKNLKLQNDIDKEKALDKIRKEFISNVSHELKTPIAHIQGYAAGLKVNVNEDEESKDYYCDVIIDESAKMEDLVMNLLDLSTMEKEGFTIEKSNFSINELINATLGRFIKNMREKNVQTIFNTDKNYMVSGDMFRIEQVLVNFLSNAVDHVSEGGSIIVEITEFETIIEISIFNTGEKLLDKELIQIWDSFYKVDKARTRDFGGTGLGLSIIKKILQLHNYNYGVLNEQNGVKFWFEMDKATSNF